MPMYRHIFSIQKILLLILLFFSYTVTNAQYFGRNKVHYSKIDFKVLETPTFEIYHYLDNESFRNKIAQQSEQWYKMHQVVLRDTFKERNPMIFYNTHAEFQQTRAIQGMIGVGTGGVTEALKNRVIMPFMESNQQTDHVLGHELVHAFQYHLIQDTLTLNAISNLPLWMVEGLAEYMSIGYIDAHTAIWMRSAVANNKLPTLKDLTNKPNEFFPYRWGQAFWAYVTGLYGDVIIRRLFVESARVGYAQAIKNLFKIDEKVFSANWQESLKAAYEPLKTGTSATPAGQQLITKRNAGELNIIPSLSPDGTRIAFWTEKNLFSIDLYVADAATGEISERITSNSYNSHIDEYSSFESAVAWSPDSRQLAFVAFAKGRNRLIIAGADNGKINKQIDIPGVASISNPTWSPDGKNIVFTGLVQGHSDLYAYNLNTGKVRQLTNDRYSDLQPSFSPDGKWIVFATDKLSIGDKKVQHQYAHNLALLNFETGAVTQLNFFSGANNLNPVFSSDNNVVYFLSDRDGFRNLYSFSIQSQQLQQLTNLYTGITGITMFAPALTSSRSTDKIAYTYYNGDEYNIYSATSAQLTPKNVSEGDVNMQAAMLPPFNRAGHNTVKQNLANTPFELVAVTSFKEVPYSPKFQLDYIGNTGVGVATGSFGTGLAGGVNGIFSDILGNNQLFGAIALNGELYDVGGQFAYLNQSNRINWGVSLSHIPFLSGAERFGRDSIELNGTKTEVINYSLDLLRTFQDQVSVFASYPFSQIRRIEGGTSFARYYYRLDRYTNYYDPSGNFYLGEERERLPTPEGFNFGQGYLALVGDNSHFGVASPLAGHRFRFEASRYLGVVDLTSVSGDYRKYFRLAPLTLATRNMYMARFGKDAESGILPPLYVGYASLVRGYDARTFVNKGGQGVTINDLIGNRIYVSNVELRYPLSGPERLSGIKSGFLFSELNLFTDAGIAWGNTDIPGDNKPGNLVTRNSKLVLSSGVSLRVNLFGYLIIEPYYAVPWQNGGFKNANFGLNFIPGW